VPVVLGSRSTYVLGALGGHEGRTLQAGDRLKLGRRAAPIKQGRAVATDLRRAPGASVELRVLTGLYWHRVAEQSGRGFFRGYVEGGAGSGSHRLSLPRRASARIRAAHAAFRRGLRSVEHCRRMLSVRVIQVPGGSEPIVLHRDAVSGGGYFMLVR